MDIQEKILEGAGDLFMRYGIRSVSMDDIARQLSMSKKTLYQYFKDKDHMVLLATRAHLEMEKQAYNEVEEMASNAIEELIGVNSCIRRGFKNINHSLLFDLKKYHPDAWKEWLNFKNIFIKSFIAGNLKRGIKEGFFRKEIDPELLASLRVEQVQMAFNNQFFPGDKYTLRDIQLIIFDHFVRGILTEEGRKAYTELKENTDLTAI